MLTKIVEGILLMRNELNKVVVGLNQEGLKSDFVNPERGVPSWSLVFSVDKDLAWAFISEFICLAANESTTESRPI